MSADELGNALLLLAHNAIGRRFGMPAKDIPELDALDAAGATFVTLTQDGELRGCIGTLEAHRPLRQDVSENALAAAFHDPRFAPLRESELEHTRIEVSLLTAPEPMTFKNEADALAQLVPGVDGIILSAENHRATFLPQVWESLPDAHQFIAQLKRKAGLPADSWSEQMNLARYRVTKWKEAEAQWA